MKGLLIYLTCTLFASVVFSYETKECSKASDCGPNECCVLGMVRYSVPICKPLGSIGDFCLMENEPEDKELYYPNQVLQVFGVYRLFCPCASALTCSRAHCV